MKRLKQQADVMQKGFFFFFRLAIFLDFFPKDFLSQSWQVDMAQMAEAIEEV